MITIKISGGLWNQMFQYAYIQALSEKHKQEFSLDTNDYKTYFRPFELSIFWVDQTNYTQKNIPPYQRFSANNKYLAVGLHLVQKILRKYDSKHFIEKQYNFDEDFLNITSGYIQWVFQTQKYFKNIEDTIRKNFSFPKIYLPANSDIAKTIQASNSVSIHIRRWDYVASSKAQNFHGTCNIPYYEKAIQKIKSSIHAPHFFIFSDDIEWVKQNLIVDGPSHYIDWNTWNNSWEDMRLMSLCKHNIVANSSFSWWWAWLNNYKEKIVIGPGRWINDDSYNTTDVMPKSWIKI